MGWISTFLCWVLVDLIRPVRYVLCWICERSDPNLLQPMVKKLVALKKTSVLNIFLPHKSKDDFFFSSFIKFQFHQFQRLGFVLGIGFLGNFIKYVWLLFNFPWNYMYTSQLPWERLVSLLSLAQKVLFPLVKMGEVLFLTYPQISIFKNILYKGNIFIIFTMYGKL